MSFGVVGVVPLLIVLRAVRRPEWAPAVRQRAAAAR
ncbi:hypothetical protein P3T29_005146 [Kitasatospora sp. MAP5-34]|nr:hypothetical protein [Kitasatospora sp. MAP5-34]